MYLIGLLDYERELLQDPKEEEEEIAREIKAYRKEHAQRRR